MPNKKNVSRKFGFVIKTLVNKKGVDRGEKNGYNYIIICYFFTLITD